MRVIVATGVGPTGERFESALRGRGFDVVRVDDKELKGAVSRGQPDVVLVDTRHSLRVLSKLPAASRPHALLILRKLDDRSVSSGVSEGAGDIIAASAGVEELVFRVQLAGRLAVKGAPSSQGRIGDSAAWTKARETLDTRLVDVIGSSDVQSHPIVGSCEPGLATCIRLTCCEDASTLDILVGVERADGERLMLQMLPGAEPSDELVRDYLQELSNVSAGALKEVSMNEGVETTLSLPVPVDPSVFAHAGARWQVETMGVRLYYGLVASVGRTDSLPISALEPGMVLEHDVLNPFGVPFVRAGLALSERTIDRLGEVLGASFLVDVVHGPRGVAEALARTG